MVTLKLSDEDFEALCDSVAFGIQRLFDECDECEYKNSSYECCKNIDHCIKQHWEMHPEIVKLDCVEKMSDLISRQAAIDALSKGEGCGNICRRGIERIPSVDECDVVAEYCRKRCLVIMTADLFEKIKREYGGDWIR